MSVFASNQERIKYLSDAIDVVKFAEAREMDRINPLKNELAKLNKKKSWILKAFIYWNSGIIAFAVLGTIVEKIFGSNKFSAVLLIAVGITVIAMLVKVNNGIKANKAQKIADINAKIHAEQAWINEFYTKNWNAVQHIPCTYRTTEALTLMKGYVLDGRADNLQAAMNLCDAQLHRWRMEVMQSEIVAENRDQSASLRGIHRSSKTTAVASVANVLIKLCK